MTSKTLTQGAEAIIKLEDNHIIKDRIKKSYRIKDLVKKQQKCSILIHHTQCAPTIAVTCWKFPLKTSVCS
jgi:hypothetical protein